jgi:hypothetical protein
MGLLRPPGRARPSHHDLKPGPADCQFLRKGFVVLAASMNSEAAVQKAEIVLLVFGFLREHRTSFPQAYNALEREAADILRPRRPSMKSLQEILVLRPSSPCKNDLLVFGYFYDIL